MIRRKNIAILLGAVALMAACAPKDNNQMQALPTGSAVSIEKADFHPLGGEVKFTVTAAHPWEVSNIPDWLELKLSSGTTVKNGVQIKEGTHQLVMRAGINEEHTGKDTKRTATLMINNAYSESGDGIDVGLEEEIVVTQPCPYLVIRSKKLEGGEEWTLTEEELVTFPWNYTEQTPFGPTSPEMEFIVECNTDWNIEYLSEIKPNFVEKIVAEEFDIKKIKPAAVRADGRNVIDGWLLAPDMGKYAENETFEHRISFLPTTYNVTGLNRGMKLRITAPNDSAGDPLESYYLDFSQNNVRFVVDIRKEEVADYTINYAPCYNEDVTVVIDSEIDWRITDKASWLKFSPNTPMATGCTKDSEPTQFTVNVSHPGCTETANAYKEDISDVFTIVAQAGQTTLPIDVTVNQKGYVFEVGTTHYDITNSDTSLHAQTIASSGAWVVDECPEWLQAQPEGAAGDESGVQQPQLYVRAKSQNLNFTDNQGTIVYKSTLNGMTATATVKQDAYIFKAETDYTTINTMDMNSHPIRISSSGSWSARVVYDYGDSDWLQLSKTQGTGDAQITFKALSGNDNTFDRKATIIIESTTHTNAGVDVDDIEFEITQRQYVFEVNPLPSALTMKYGPIPATTYSVNIVCSHEWSVVTPDWITVDYASGTGDRSVTFSANINPDYESRSGVVKIESIYKDFVRNYTFNVNQDRFEFSVEPTVVPDIPPVLESASYQAEIVCSGSWSLKAVGEAASWIHPTISNGNGGTTTVSFRLDHNIQTSERSGVVEISSLRNDDTKTIEFYQKKFEFNDAPVSYEVNAFKPSGESFEVVCSGEWELRNVPSWVTATPSSGKGNATVQLTIKNNYYLEQRQSNDFKVYSKMNGLEKPISIVQKPFIFDTEEVVLNSFTALSPETQSVSLGEIMEGWVLDGVVADRLTVSQESGKGGGITFTVGAKENYKTSKVEGVFYVKSEYYDENPALRKPIRYSQNQFLFPTALVSSNFDELNDLTTTVELGNIMASWSVVNVPEWLKVSTTVAGEESVSMVTVEAQPNYTLSSRKADMKIQSQYVTQNPALTRTYSVTQDAFVFNINDLNVSAFEPVDARQYAHSESKGSADWTIASQPDWLEVSLDNQGSTYGLNILPRDNNAMENRSGEVIIESQYVSQNPLLTRKVKVSQKAYEFESKEANLVVGPLNATSQLGVVCSGEWAISGAPTWATLGSNDGKGHASVNITVDDNYQLSPRSATMQLLSKPNSLTRTVNLAQNAYVFDTQSETKSAPALSSNVTVALGDCSAGWSVKNVPSWLSVTPMSGRGSATLTIRVEDNVEFVGRSTENMVVESEHVGFNSLLSKPIEISQAAFEYDTEGVNLGEYAAMDSSSQTVTLASSTGRWSVKGAPSWVVVSPMSGSGSAELTVRVNNNTSTSLRSCELRIESEKYSKNNNLVKLVTLSQAAYEFDQTPVSLNEFTALDAIDQSVSLAKCTGSWTVNAPDWVTVSQKSGTGAATISIGANDNVLTTPRSGVVKIVSADNSALVKEVSVSQAAYDFDSAVVTLTKFTALSPESQTVTLTKCTGSWTVNAPEWVTVTPNAGSGSTTLTISARENVTMSELSGSVRIVSKENSNLVKVVNISQAAYEFDTTPVTKQFVAMGAVAQNVTLSKCTGSWTVDVSEPWVSVSPESGEGGGVSYTITVGDNYNTAQRRATVKIVSTDNSALVKEITIVQAAYEFDQSAATVQFVAYGASAQSVSLSKCTGSWKAASSESWLTVSPTNGSGSATISLSAANNLTTAARNAVVRIESVENPSLVKVVNVSQNAYELTVSGNVTEYAPMNGATQNISVVCSGKWTISVPSWATAQPASGTGNATVAISVTNNTNNQKRSGNVVVSSSDVSALSRNVSISQAAYALSVTPTTLSFAVGATAAKNVAVTCSGSWTYTVSAGATWLSASKSGGNLVVTPTANATGAERKATITITSSDNAALKYTVQVTQAGK